PTSGTAKVGGYDVLENPYEVRKLIGYLPETVPLYADMLVSEYLDFIGQARHLNGTFNSRRDWVVEACGLESVLKRKISVLSKGYKQRTCLAQALIHDPEVLILDEPTSGLDPLQIIGIRKLVKELSHEKTIILSTHILPEVTTLADRILVINNGRLVGDGTFDDLQAKVTEKNSIFLIIKADRKDFEKKVQDVQNVDDVRYIDTVKKDQVQCHIFYKPQVDILDGLNNMIRENNWDVIEFHQEKLSLEDSFIRLTQGRNSGSAESKSEGKSDEGGAA
ncbi:ATP-binding cassette domain-containing protein, partial [candidate division KSB1 bacterium]|nr:ATP-binding cassette domain-containing protein [candidate division KSB1 bacterium]